MFVTFSAFTHCSAEVGGYRHTGEESSAMKISIKKKNCKSVKKKMKI